MKVHQHEGRQGERQSTAAQISGGGGMSEMMQRVVAAIAETQARRRLLGNRGQPEALALAIAAIEAMREPTWGMLQAAVADTTAANWRAMIDEALK